METINIHEAKTHLSRLVEQAAKGEPFIIAKAGKPLVMVVPLDAPAGLYPEGATPEGLHDLAGNAWEWTRTLWGTKPGTPHFRYPLRGGRWARGPASGRKYCPSPAGRRVQRQCQLRPLCLPLQASRSPQPHRFSGSRVPMTLDAL
ncbi:MAG: type II toxin-antitoxin system prevent-host-death family antitoxin [Gammaproteobacteria bacterium]